MKNERKYKKMTTDSLDYKEEEKPRAEEGNV
jgi:hypothetical protein